MPHFLVTFTEEYLGSVQVEAETPDAAAAKVEAMDAADELQEQINPGYRDFRVDGVKPLSEYL